MTSMLRPPPFPGGAPGRYGGGADQTFRARVPTGEGVGREPNMESDQRVGEKEEEERRGTTRSLSEQRAPDQGGRAVRH